MPSWPPPCSARWPGCSPCERCTRPRASRPPSAPRHFPVPETTARSFQGAPLVTINDFPLYRRLLDETRPYRLHIVGVFVLSLLASPLALLTPVPLKVAVDSVLDSHPVPHALDAL